MVYRSRVSHRLTYMLIAQTVHIVPYTVHRVAATQCTMAYSGPVHSLCSGRSLCLTRWTAHFCHVRSCHFALAVCFSVQYIYLFISFRFISVSFGVCYAMRCNVLFCLGSCRSSTLYPLTGMIFRDISSKWKARDKEYVVTSYFYLDFFSFSLSFGPVFFQFICFCSIFHFCKHVIFFFNSIV